MIINKEIKRLMNQSVLCWLATCDIDLVPNVSPKEIFALFKDDEVIIANIASPQTIKNIRNNPLVAVSFVDVLVQKGFQLKGNGRIIDHDSLDFRPRAEVLEEMTEGLFTIRSIVSVQVLKCKPIIAPRYLFYPDTTEEDQVKNAKKRYNLND